MNVFSNFEHVKVIKSRVVVMFNYIELVSNVFINSGLTIRSVKDLVWVNFQKPEFGLLVEVKIINFQKT